MDAKPELGCEPHRDRFPAWALVFSLAVVLGGGGLFAYRACHEADKRLRTDLLTQVRMVTQVVNGERIANLSGSTADLDSPDYQRLKEQLTLVRSVNARCCFLYLLGMKGADVFFFLDSEPADSKDNSPPGQLYAESPEAMRRAFTGMATVAGPYSDRWGTWITAMSPIMRPGTGDVLAVFCMDVDARGWSRDVDKAGVPAILIALLLAMILVFFFVLLRRSENATRRIVVSEAEVRESSKRFEAIVDHVQAGIFLIDPVDHKVVVANRKAAEMCGATRAEMVGRVCHQYVCPARSGECPITDLHQVVETSECILVTADGGEIPIIKTVIPVNIDGRDLLQESFIDVTDRKRAEDEREKADALLQAAISQSPSGILIADAPDVTIRWANPAALGIRGDSPSLLTGIDVTQHSVNWQIFRLDGTPYPSEELPLSRAVLKGETTCDEEVIIRNEAGEDRWVNVNAAPVRNSHGVITAGIVIFHDITEGKRAAAELGRARCRLEAASMAGRVALWELDIASGQLEWSEAVDTMLGLPPKAFERTLTTWLDIIHPGDRHRVEETLAAHLDHAAPYDVEYRVRRADGTWAWWRDTGAAQRDEHGKTFSMAGACADVTDRRRAEEALRGRQEIIDAIVETSQDWIWEIDADGIHTFSNPAIQRILGRSEEEILGEPNLNLLYEEDLAKVQAMLPECIRERQGWNNLLLRWRHKDGSYRYLESNAVPIVDATSNVAGFRGVDRDVTDHRAAEEALKKSEEHYRRIVNTAQEGIWILDADHLTTFVNPRMAQMLGRSPEEIMGRSAHVFIAESELEDHERKMEQRKAGLSVRYERLLRNANGDEVPTFVSATPLIDSEGRFYGSFGMFTDITDRKRLEEESNRLAAVVRHSRELVNLSTPDGTMIFLNDAGRKMLGISEEDVAQTNIMQVIPEHLHEKVRQELLPALVGEGFWEGDLQYLNLKTGALTDVHAVTFSVTEPETGALRFFTNVSLDITERKRAEEKLRQSKARLDAILSSMKDVVFEIDLNGCFEGCYAQRNKRFYIQPDSFLGKKFDEVLPENVSGLLQQAIETIYAGEPYRQIEYPIAIDNMIQYENAVVTLRYNTANEIIGVTVVCRDITERKRAESRQYLLAEILGILNERLDLADAITGILAAIKRETGFDAVGIRLRSGEDYPYFFQNGFSSDFLLAEDTLVVRAEDGGNCRDEHGNVCLECTCGLVISGQTDPSNALFTLGGSCWTNDSLPLLDLTAAEDPRLHPRNRCIHEGYLSVALIPIRANREIVGLLQLNDRRKDRLTLDMVHFFEEISASIGVALLQKQAEDALRKSEEKYRVLFESSRDALMTLDPSSWSFTTVNPATVEMFRANNGRELTSCAFWQLSPERQPDGHPSAEKVKEMIETAMREGSHFFEWTHKRIDGEEFPATVLLTRMEHAGKVFLQATVRDITERKRAEAEKEKLEAQLRQAQKMEAVGQLAGGVAHDFNNLLQVILGYLEILKGVPRNDTAHGEALDEVRKAAQRAADLTRQLLTFSRRQIIQPVNLNLNEAIQSLLKMIRRIIGEHIELCFMSGDRLGTVHVDQGQMEQILMNLCVNARDAMPNGGTLTIETQNVVIGGEYCRKHPWATEGRYVLLSVTDTGHGMDEATRAQIFEPFFTTKGVGEGTGLGLATVYGIVKQHNGLLHVYSEPGKGTAFKIYFAIVEQAAEEVGPKVAAAAVGGTETILVAEDEEMVRGLAVRLLETAGYTVLAASDGEEALRVFEKHADAIDMALLDVMMPKLGGREVMDVIQARSPRMRFLFSSGYSQTAIHTNFIIKEDLRLITKPYRRADLLRAVRETLDA